MRLQLLFGTLIALCALAKNATSDSVDLFIDADYAISTSSSESIELGIRTALKEVDYEVDGTTIRIVRKDNRGNVKRSRKTMETFLESPNALAIFGGIHSPPYLTHREFINENQVLLLLPWSAAGPITRSTSAENWIFRLSVDDTKSGEFFIREAVDNGKCKSVALTLLDTGWGRANFTTITAALAERGMEPASVDYFPSSVRAPTAKRIAEQIASQATECVVILANWTNGAVVVNALAEAAPGVRVYSHWGIMGGAFAEQVPHETRQSIELTVLQTCALAREAEGNETVEFALALAGQEGAPVASLKAPTGFVHGFDLTRILIAAIRQVKADGLWTDDIRQNRLHIKEALERLEQPVTGILATYASPFANYSETQRDAHEALGLDDLCLARFREDGLLEHAG